MTIGVRVVEGVERVAGLDIDVEPRVGRGVVEENLDPVGLGVPEEANLDRPRLPLGELSAGCTELIHGRSLRSFCSSPLETPPDAVSFPGSVSSTRDRGR